MKKILILGAGFLQSFIIKRAKELGYYTICVDMNPDSIGFQYANEYKVINIVDEKLCLKYAEECNIDGVLTVATDYGVLTSSYISEHMNLNGLKFDVAQTVKNKYLIRKKLNMANLNEISQYFEVSCEDDVLGIMDSVLFPVMVKPCDGSGSKGVCKVENKEQLSDVCCRAMNSSISHKAIVETFIHGNEYGVESFVYDGEIYVLGIMGKKMTDPPYYAELGHCIPSGLSTEMEEIVKSTVRKTIEALGIDFGAVNMDLIVTPEKNVSIIDIGARMGGNLIGSHIIPLGTGIDYMGNLIRAAVGDSIDISVKGPGQNVVTRLLALNQGKVVGLPNFDEISQDCQVKVYHHLCIGDSINEYQNNLDGCGYVLAIADDIEEAKRRADKSRYLIDVGIIRN